MTAIAVDTPREYKGFPQLRAEEVAADQKIYNGALVNTLDADGFLYDGADTASSTFAGIAHEGYDATGESDGDGEAKVAKTGRFKIALDSGASFVQGDKGAEVEVKDNNTVSKSTGTTNHVKCGVFLGFWENDPNSGYGDIKIDGYAK